MKTKRFASFFVLAGMAFTIFSCSESVNGTDETVNTEVEKSINVATAPGDSCTYLGILTEADTAGLMEMREEEKLAHDVYAYFYEMYNYVLFRNISRSETAHGSAVLYLINSYGLTDPTPENSGEYNDEQFTKMYADLISVGSASLVEALKAGALIEETDIKDLETLINTTENEDIIRVYSHLLAASKIHMRAFSFALVRLGEIYTPQVISAEEYLEILGDSDSETETPETIIPSTTPGVCDGTGPNA